MASPGVTPASGRSGADVGAALVDPTAPVVAPTPTEVTERVASSAADAEQPAEGHIPLVEVVMTAPSQDQPGAVVVAPEGVVQSTSPGAQVDPPVALEAAQMEEDLVGGSLGIMAVVPHRVRREPPPAPLLGGSRSTTRGSRRSSGWPLRTRRRLFSRSMIIPRAWSGRVLTSGSRPC